MQSEKRFRPFLPIVGFFALALMVSTTFLLSPGAISHAAPQATYYVSPNGNDNNPGTKNNPFRSIQKARDVVRTINDNMSGDIVIYLRGGSYSFNNTLEFNEHDSGSNNHNVIYQAYPGETPKLEGGISVTGWTQVPGKNYFQATVNGIDDFRQVYVNDKRATRATTPAIRGKSYDKDLAGIYLYSSDLPATFAKPNEVELVQQAEWRNYRVPVESFDIQSPLAHAVFDPTIWPAYRPSNLGVDATSPLYLENAIEFLDTPGEWYFDKSSHTLYYAPRSNENLSSARVIVPKLEQFFTFKGSSLAAKVHHIQIKGLVFQHSSWALPNTKGAVNMQTTIMTDEKGAFSYTLPASIQVDNADSLHFERNKFVRMGGSAINLINGTTRIALVGNFFQDISAAAISVGTWEHDELGGEEEIPREISIKNNLLRQISVEYWGAAAISTLYTYYATISHNDIRDTSYSGISNGWGFKDPDTLSTNNNISYNRIFDVMKRTRDGGGIYTLGKQSDSSLNHNYIVNINGLHGGAALYHDEGSSGWNDHDNVVDPGRPDFLSYHLNQNGTVRSNNLYSTNGLVADHISTDWSSTNTFIYPDANWPPAARQIIADSGLEPVYRDLLKLVNDPPYPSIWNRKTIQEENHQVAIEAESFTGYRGLEAGSQSWLGARQWFSGYSGHQAMLSHPAGLDSGAETTGPRLDYKVNFKDTGTFFVYVRGKSEVPGNGTSDSLHIGLDGQKATTCSPEGLDGFTGSFTWRSLCAGQPLTIHVPTTGDHTISVWASESGVYFDKLVLSKTAQLLVEGDTVIGPIENRRVGQPAPAYSPYPLDAEPQPANVAVDKPTTASSSYSDQFGKWAGNDGSLTFEWVAANDDPSPWWQVDLETARSIKTVEFMSRLGYDFPTYRKNFEIRASNDSAFGSYTVLHSQGETLHPFGKTLIVNVEDTTKYRYIRVVKTVANEIFAFTELRVYGADIFDTLEDFNQTSSHSSNLRIEQADFEKDFGKAQRTSSDAASLVYQLENLKRVQVKLYSHFTESAASLNLYTSADGTTWTKITTVRAGSAVHVNEEWLRQYLTVENIPAGSHYLKVEIPQGGSAWTPLIGLVTITQ